MKSWQLAEQATGGCGNLMWGLLTCSFAVDHALHAAYCCRVAGVQYMHADANVEGWL
jgi:hypothetical protein